MHSKTFITIVNNGSCNEIKVYLDDLLDKNAIQELIHTQNIGKLNAILKGISGHQFELVTIFLKLLWIFSKYTPDSNWKKSQTPIKLEFGIFKFIMI